MRVSHSGNDTISKLLELTEINLSRLEELKASFEARDVRNVYELRSPDELKSLTADELGVTDEQYYHAIRVSLLERLNGTESAGNGLTIFGGRIYVNDKMVVAVCLVTLPF